MSVSTAARSRVELSSRTAILALGDVLAILVFVAAGEYTHGFNPFVDVGRVAGTLAPFLIGWAIVATASGLYAPASGTSIGRTVGKTFLAWILAVAIAQGLRATAVFHGSAALTFAIVSVVIGGALLCLWRGAVQIFDL